MARIALAGAVAIGFSALAVSGLQRTRAKIADVRQRSTDVVAALEETFVIGGQGHGALHSLLTYI